MDPSGRVEARIGASPHGQGLRHDAGANRRRSSSASRRRDVRVRARRYRPHALRLGHLRQPLAGDLRRRHRCWRRAKSAKSFSSSPSHVLEAAPDDIVLEDGNAKVSGTDRTRDDRGAGARRLSSDPSFQGRNHAGIERDARITIRPAPSPMPVMSPSSRSMSRPAASRIEKFLAVEDAGRIINPLIADGQVHGGIAQGIGNALFEEIIYDGLGNIQTATLADYCRRPRAKFRRSNCTTSKRRRPLPSPAPRAWAKAAPSARRPPCSMPSTTRCRRSASRSTKFRRRRSASAPRCARRVPRLGRDACWIKGELVKRELI